MKTGLYAYAVRYMQDDEDIVIGSECRPSYDWDYVNDCSCYETDGTQLPGTSGLYLQDIDEDSTAEEIQEAARTAIRENIEYHGTPVIIGGNRWIDGRDYNEVIIKDAEIVDIL